MYMRLFHKSFKTVQNYHTINKLTNNIWRSFDKQHHKGLYDETFDKREENLLDSQQNLIAFSEAPCQHQRV